MITGAHSIVYSTQPDADRAFLRDVLRLPSVDAGQGWLIFGLPPAEVAVHPADDNDVHELYLICENVASLVEQMTERGIAASAVQDRGWGLVTQITLPGGGKLGVYEARHPRPPVSVAPKAKAAPKRAKQKKAAAKKTVKKRVPAKRGKKR